MLQQFNSDSVSSGGISTTDMFEVTEAVYSVMFADLDEFTDSLEDLVGTCRFFLNGSQVVDHSISFIFRDLGVNTAGMFNSQSVFLIFRFLFKSSESLSEYFQSF